MKDILILNFFQSPNYILRLRPASFQRNELKSGQTNNLKVTMAAWIKLLSLSEAKSFTFCPYWLLLIRKHTSPTRHDCTLMILQAESQWPVNKLILSITCIEITTWVKIKSCHETSILYPRLNKISEIKTLSLRALQLDTTSRSQTALLEIAKAPKAQQEFLPTCRATQFHQALERTGENAFFF